MTNQTKINPPYPPALFSPELTQVLAEYMRSKQISLKRLTKSACAPRQATPYASGYDLFFDIESDVIIPPYETEVIGTGIALAIPPTHTGLIFPRSSAHKVGADLANGTGVIDPDYRGEIKLAVKNTQYDQQLILQRDKPLFQIVFVATLCVVFVEEEDLTHTVRGVGGFGSTDADLVAGILHGER